MAAWQQWPICKSLMWQQQRMLKNSCSWCVCVTETEHVCVCVCVYMCLAHFTSPWCDNLSEYRPFEYIPHAYTFWQARDSCNSCNCVSIECNGCNYVSMNISVYKYVYIYIYICILCILYTWVAYTFLDQVKQEQIICTCVCVCVCVYVHVFRVDTCIYLNELLYLNTKSTWNKSRRLKILTLTPTPYTLHPPLI